MSESHQAALYIDRKADFARKMARFKPSESDMWLHVARLLDNAADEIQLGFHMREDAGETL